MERPSSLMDDAEFRLPPEFLTDDDFLVENENKLFNKDECHLFPYEPSHGFGDGENYLTGVTRKMVQSSLEDDFSGRFCGNYAFPAGKAWGATRSSLCGAGDSYGRRSQSSQTRVSSQAEAWDLYCAAVEKLARMKIGDESYGYNSGREIIDLPRKHTLADYDGAGYYSRQSLQYQKLQALQFQQLQLMQQSRGLKANNNNKIAGHVNLSPSAWSNQPQKRDGSGMRAVFLGDRTGKPRSTGTGVFLPRLVNHTEETREKPTLATVLIPARVAEVLNLDESVVQPSVRSFNEPSWRQKSYIGRFSSQMKMEQTVNEPRLPSEWAY